MSSFKPCPPWNSKIWRDQAECDNCGKVWQIEALHWIESAEQRLDAGGVVPAGQCPDEECGACCYAMERAPEGANQELIFMRDIIAAFPGFVNDTDVNGGDLVDFIDSKLREKTEGKPDGC